MGIPMKDKNQQTLYKLFRDLGDVQGIARMTLMSLNSFIESIQQLKCTREQLPPLYTELAEIIKKAQPNIIPLRRLLRQLEKDLQPILALETDDDVEAIRQKVIEGLQEKIAQFQGFAARVTENGLKYISDGDVIIAHSPSTVVTNILVQAKEKLNRDFKVIILDHNPERTRQTVRALRHDGIEHTVAPAHNLSHHVEKANKMFVGALTITSDRKIVAALGTAGTVGLCHLNNIAVHMFANSLHYSRRSSMDQSIFQGLEDTYGGPNINFPMITHSHDLVSLGLINHIITEEGEIKNKNYPIPQKRILPE